MSSTADAIGALGSDLAFSVSFGIAGELLAAAQDAQLGDDELVGIVLTLSVVLGAIPKGLLIAYKEVSNVVGVEIGNRNSSELLNFLNLLIDVARRISISITVQLLSANVRSKQPQRAVRIVSLLTIAVFFLFLEATSSLGKRGRR